MRVVRRTTIVVPTLSPEGVGGRQAKLHETDRAKNEAAKLSFPAHWNKKDVRGALYALFGRACAYCGCELKRNDRGDVEHYRPKGNVTDEPGHGGYWWLAYVFDNYLLSCSVCNRVRKKDRFPLRPQGVRVAYATRATLASEPRLLLSATLDTVEDWLDVEWKKEPCTIRANDSLSADVKVQIEGTLEFFRINVDPELLRERNAVRNAVLKAFDEKDFDAARMLAVRYRPHSLVAKQMLAEHAPAHLPSPKDETRWLLEDLMATLLYALDLLEKRPQDRILKEQVEELLWSFAVLWRDPPAGTSQAEVEAFLTKQEIITQVRKYLNKL